MRRVINKIVMKVKIFSHVADPDGLGCVVLAKLVYEDVSFTLCNYDDINVQFHHFIENKEYENFDKIFITDISLSNEYLKKIQENDSLRAKCLLFDHHESFEKTIDGVYDFVTLKIKTKEGLCSGTSLFYEYLKNSTHNKILEKQVVEEFVRLTRLHDTWEWKRENNLKAYHLQDLFQFLSPFGYLYHFVLKCQKEDVFCYTSEEENWINIQIQNNEKAINQMLHQVIVKTESSITYGSLFGLYEYRNALAEKLKISRPEIDIMILLAVDNQSASFRSLKDIPVDGLALEYGGGGHARTAACPLNPETTLKLIKRFMI